MDQMEIRPAEMSERENDYEKVIQRLTSKIRESAQKAESLSSACIYRVPKEIRKLNESAYTPRLIAIGPLHRNDEHLQTPLQHVKMSYMNNLLCRMTQGMENQVAEQKKILRECVVEMEMSIEDAKKWYAEEVMLDVEMMLVDGCFILEFLYKLRLYYWNYTDQGETPDPIFANDLNCIHVQHDLLLLENQIPFLVLERVFPLTLARIPNNPLKNLSLTDYVFLPRVDYLMRPVEGKSTNNGSSSAKTCCWPRVLWVSGSKMNTNSKPEEKVVSREEEVPLPIPTSDSFDHILHKLHLDYLPQDQTAVKGVLESGPAQYLPSASELVYAGVKFVPGTGNDLFKVKFTEPESPFWWFRSARFQIPCIHVERDTELVLRNFIAYEKCCSGISQHFTSYAVFMDRLVNSDIDLQVIEKAEVILNSLGASEDATNTFDKLSKGVPLATPEFLFAETCNRAITYSKRFWPKNMAYVRRKYFASPWTFIAFCLAFIAFAVTIAQFILSIVNKCI